MSLKKLKVKNLRNILESPFNIHWSNSNLEGAALLQKILEELLPLAKLENKSLNFSKDKNREKTRSSTTSVKKHNNIYRTYLAPGFQSVLRGLEKNELCCVLLSSDVSPPMIQRVVCGYCNAYGIPFIIFSELKTITKSNLGFSTMVLGLKKIAESPENKFYPIYEIVSQNPCIFETDFVVKQKEAITPYKEDQCNFKDVSTVTNKNWYLYREKRNERAFRPGTEAGSTENSQCQPSSKEGKSKNFISLNKKESKMSNIELLEKSIPNREKNSASEDDSDDDSMDEVDVFFVDKKPDLTLMEAELSNNEGNNPQANAEFEGLCFNSKLNKKIGIKENKVKTKNERYFLSQVNKNTKNGKFRKKGKRVSKEQTTDVSKSGSMEGMDKFASSTFKSLKIKTIVSNPKKIRRKKK